MENIKIDKDLMMNSFTDISNIANTKMMTCYNTVFQKRNILKNIGCFIFGSVIILNLIFLFLFLVKYYNILKKEIEKIKIHILNNGKIYNIFGQKKKGIINRLEGNKNETNNESSQRKMKINNNINSSGKKQEMKKSKIKRKIKFNHSPPKKNKININNINNNNNNNKYFYIKNNVINNNK